MLNRELDQSGVLIFHLGRNFQTGRDFLHGNDFPFGKKFYKWEEIFYMEIDSPKRN